MNVTLITYDAPHAKTLDIYLQLRGSPNLNVSILIAPFINRPSREALFKHRPEQFRGPHIRDVAKYYNLQVWEYDQREIAVNNSNYLLIGGANILEPELANCGKIINGHAGLIPLSRGLDAFKWAIFNMIPVGNTLHFIDENTDSGSVIHHEITPLFANDTLESFAERHYQLEICLLSRFLDYLHNGCKLRLQTTEPRRRMPIDLEREMIKKFDIYKQKFALNTSV